MHRVVLLVVGASTACGFSPSATQPIDAPPVSIDTPVDTPIAKCKIQGVAAGGDHTCASVDDGSVYCWGRGQNGELGISPVPDSCFDGTSTVACSKKPNKVQLPGAVIVGVGSYHSCALTVSGAYCWGLNGFGEYGDGAIVDATPTKLVTQRAGAELFDGGVFHTCSLAAGHVTCSGKNTAGEVGDNSMSVQDTATDVLQGASSISTGAYTTCAVVGTSLSCWGRNTYKTIDATQANKLTPTSVSQVANVAKVALGLDHICAVLTDHTAKCWGSNTIGQLGDGSMSASPQTPVTVGVANVADVSAEAYHTCVLDMDGAVWCFGEKYTPTPTKITLSRPALAIASGDEHECAILDDHSLWCWGDQKLGQLGNGTSSATRQVTPNEVSICSN